jgi:ABC-2 type transport system permease protein
VIRIRALLAKELADLRRNPAVFFPAVLTGALTIVLPFMIAIAIPYFTGERLSDSSDFEAAIASYTGVSGLEGLDPEGAVQAFIFQQFLVMLVLTPVAGSMSMAAYSVIGEKQARTLEPLLATPITTLELLSAKVLGSFLPALGLTVASFVCYLLGVVILARPGVFMVLLTPGALGIIFVLGPMASLAALQLAVCVSSRVNDPRSAQQIGALIILPIAALLVAQLSGTIVMTGPLVTVFAIVLAHLNVLLMGIGIWLFRRESILTRWK